MPETPYKRLQIVTVPRVYAALKRISVASGDPMGTIVRQMLEEGLPALEEIADALESVPKSPGAALARMSQTLERAGNEARQMGLELESEGKTLVQRATRHAKRQAARKAARE